MPLKYHPRINPKIFFLRVFLFQGNALLCLQSAAQVIYFTNGRRSHSASVAQSPLKPNSGVREPLQKEVTEYWMKMIHQFLWDITTD